MSYRLPVRPPRIQALDAANLPFYPSHADSPPPSEALLSPTAETFADPFQVAFWAFQTMQRGGYPTLPEEQDPLYLRAKGLASGRIQPSREGGFWPPPSRETTHPGNTVLFIGNLTHDAQVWELERYFRVFGPIVSVSLGLCVVADDRRISQRTSRTAASLPFSAVAMPSRRSTGCRGSRCGEVSLDLAGVIRSVS
jgi:hypothetical protein